MNYNDELRILKKTKNESKIRFYVFSLLLAAFDIFIIPNSSIPIVIIVLINAYYFFYILNFANKWIKTNSKIKETEKKIEQEKRERSRKFGGTFDDIFGSFRDDKYRKIFEDLWEQIHEQQSQRQHQQQNTNTILTSQKLDNAYKLLKVSKTDTVEKIKKVYRELAIKWHPDKWSTDTLENQKVAERNFKKLQSAYDLIKKDKNIC